MADDPNLFEQGMDWLKDVTGWEEREAEARERNQVTAAEGRAADLGYGEPLDPDPYDRELQQIEHLIYTGEYLGLDETPFATQWTPEDRAAKYAEIIVLAIADPSKITDEELLMLGYGFRDEEAKSAGAASAEEFGIDLKQAMQFEGGVGELMSEVSPTAGMLVAAGGRPKPPGWQRTGRTLVDLAGFTGFLAVGGSAALGALVRSGSLPRTAAAFRASKDAVMATRLGAALARTGMPVVRIGQRIGPAGRKALFAWGGATTGTSVALNFFNPAKFEAAEQRQLVEAQADALNEIGAVAPDGQIDEQVVADELSRRGGGIMAAAEGTAFGFVEPDVLPPVASKQSVQDVPEGGTSVAEPVAEPVAQAAEPGVYAAGSEIVPVTDEEFERFVEENLGVDVSELSESERSLWRGFATQAKNKEPEEVEVEPLPPYVGGVPDDYKRPYLQRDVVLPGQGRIPVGVDLQRDEFARPQYREPAVGASLANLSPGKLIEFNEYAIRAGWIEDDDPSVVLNIVTPSTQTAMEAAMTMVNRNPDRYRTYWDALKEAAVIGDQMAQETERAPFRRETYVALNYAKLSEDVVGALASKLGRKASNSEITLLAEHVQNEHRSWFDDREAARHSDWVAEGRAEELGEESYGGAAPYEAFDYAGEFDKKFRETYQEELDVVERSDKVRGQMQNMVAGLNRWSSAMGG